MTAFGKAVLAPRQSASPERTRAGPVFPFWTPQKGEYAPVMDYNPKPAAFVAHRASNSFSVESPVKELRTQVKSLQQQAAQHSSDRRNRVLLSQMRSIVGLLNQPAPPPVPVPQPYHDDRYEHVLSVIQQQQDTVTELVRSLRESQVRPEGYLAQSAAGLVKQETSDSLRPERHNREPLEDQYRRVRDNPDHFHKLLAELDFKDDKSETFINGDSRYVFKTDLSNEDKAKILLKLEEEKKARDQDKKRQGIQGIRRLRAVAMAVIFPVYAYATVMKRKKDTKSKMLKAMEAKISIFLEGAKTWALQAIRVPLVSVVGDQELDLNVIEGGREERKGKQFDRLSPKYLKLQVRIRGILEGLREHTSVQAMPAPLRIFIENLISEGSYTPRSYFLDFEKSRIERDSFGALKNQSAEKREMLICFFFITRVIVKGILLKSAPGEEVVRVGGRAEG